MHKVKKQKYNNPIKFQNGIDTSHQFQTQTIKMTTHKRNNDQGKKEKGTILLA